MSMRGDDPKTAGGHMLGVSRAIHSIRQFLSAVLLFSLIFAGMGGLVYGLYRVAVISKSVYAVVFYIAFGGLIVFYVVRGFRKKLLSRIFIRITAALVKLLFILFCIVCVVLYAAFVVRFPVAGAAVSPILIVLIIFSFLRLKIGVFLRKYINYLRQRY